jgi:hypothetical protein
VEVADMSERKEVEARLRGHQVTIAERILSGELQLLPWQVDTYLKYIQNPSSPTVQRAIQHLKNKRAFLKRLDNNVKR